ncbi:hypothetical protein OC834_001752 [Tilletia horrida]|nr:hypothetical protein OC834_001752 [Tilletia horrida]
MPIPVLPGELINLIVANAIVPSPTEDESYRTFGRRIRDLSLVSPAFKMAVQLQLRQNFHTFRVDKDSLVRARIVPWLPDPRDAFVIHRTWWAQVAKQELEDVNNIERASAALNQTDFSVVRTLSLDLRISRIHADSGPRMFQRFQVPQWVAVTNILTRMVDTARSLEELHLRIPPQQNMVDMVQTIIANNIRLRSIIVEIDSVNQPNSIYQPKVDLTSLCNDKVVYSQLTCFIIRAPTASCTVTNSAFLFDRLRKVKLFALSVAALDTPLPNWQWVRKFLQHTPDLERCDVSVSYRNASDKTAFLREEPATLSNLTNLILDLKDVDTRILLNLDAPKLSYLRIHSPIDIDHWPCIPQDHFPSLFSVNIWCPGSSATRMDVLGIPRSEYAHNLNDRHNYSLHHGAEFLAYVKPYAASHPGPRTSTVQEHLPGQIDLTAHDDDDIDDDDEADSELSDFDSSDLESLSDVDADGEVDANHVNAEAGAADHRGDAVQQHHDSVLGSNLSFTNAGDDNSSTSDGDASADSADTTSVDNSLSVSAKVAADSQRRTPQAGAAASQLTVVTAVGEPSATPIVASTSRSQPNFDPSARMPSGQDVPATSQNGSVPSFDALIAVALSSSASTLNRRRREDDVEDSFPSKRIHTT